MPRCGILSGNESGAPNFKEKQTPRLCQQADPKAMWELTAIIGQARGPTAFRLNARSTRGLA